MTDRSQSGNTNLQSDFFGRARRSGQKLVLYLVNGKKITGRLRAFDRFTILVDTGGSEEMIFKHAISTVHLRKPAGGEKGKGKGKGKGRGKAKGERKDEPKEKSHEQPLSHRMDLSGALGSEKSEKSKDEPTSDAAPSPAEPEEKEEE